MLNEPINVMTIKITTDKKALLILTKMYFADEIKRLIFEQKALFHKSK